MNQPVLLGFGDSWAAGHDLATDEKCYLQLVAEQLDIPYHNFAVGSSSVPHMIVQFQNFVETIYFPQNQYHAVFFLTAQERNFCYDQDNKQIVHLSPSSTPGHDYYKMYNNELGEFVFNSAVLALQRLCHVYSIKDYYVSGWQINKLWPSIDRTKFWRQGQNAVTELFHDHKGFVNLLDLLKQRPKNLYFGSTHDHPNQLGHERIAQELIDWIKID